MKKLTVSLLALAGGAIVASAAATKSPDLGYTYNLDAHFTNPPVLVGVSGVPTINTNFTLFPGSEGIVLTDGAGKIDGVYDMYITNLTAASPLDQGSYIADITGSITTTTSGGNPNPVPVVTVSMKGNGYSQDADNTTNGTSSFSLTFSSKNAGGVHTNSSVAGPFTTNVFLVTDIGNGNFFTNPIPTVYAPQTNFIVRSGPTNLPYLTFTLHHSDTNVINFGTNGVFNWVYEQSNAADTNGAQRRFYFGTGTVVSNLYFLFGTNLFQIAKIAQSIDYEAIQIGTNVIVDEAETNDIYGIRIEDVPSFINAFTQANTSSSNPVQLVYSVVTNNDFFSVGITNTTVSGLNIYSNSWAEVPGLVNGSVKSGKKNISVKNAPGSYTTPHFTFTPFTIPFVTTNGFTTNNVTNVVPILVTNETQYVLRQNVSGGSIELNTFSSLFARVVQFGKKLWTSTGDDLAFSGKGSVNPTTKKQTYSLNLKGVAWSKGSSLKLTGNTASNYVAGYKIATNVITITNTASIGQVNHTFTNTTGFPQTQEYGEFTTNVVVTLVSTNVVISENFYGDPGLAIPGLLVTNINTTGIRTVIATGKVRGQALPKAGVSGVNPDVPLPLD